MLTLQIYSATICPQIKKQRQSVLPRRLPLEINVNYGEPLVQGGFFTLCLEKHAVEYGCRLQCLKD